MVFLSPSWPFLDNFEWSSQVLGEVDVKSQRVRQTVLRIPRSRWNLRMDSDCPAIRSVLDRSLSVVCILDLKVLTRRCPRFFFFETCTDTGGAVKKRTSIP